MCELYTQSPVIISSLNMVLNLPSAYVIFPPIGLDDDVKVLSVIITKPSVGSINISIITQVPLYSGNGVPNITPGSGDVALWNDLSIRTLFDVDVVIWTDVPL